MDRGSLHPTIPAMDTGYIHLDHGCTLNGTGQTDPRLTGSDDDIIVRIDRAAGQSQILPRGTCDDEVLINFSRSGKITHQIIDEGGPVEIDKSPHATGHDGPFHALIRQHVLVLAANAGDKDHLRSHGSRRFLRDNREF
jgi:hypothetical protein